MKTIITRRMDPKALLPFYLFALLLLTACSNDDPFATAAPDDYPHILSPVFPDRVNGALPTIATLNRDANYKTTVTVTPHDYTTVTWLIDGEQVAEGDSIDISLPAGTYDLKIVATTTEGKSTSREGYLKVNPLDGDPYSSAKGYERIIAPGAEAILYGDNLERVVYVTINGTQLPATYDSDSQSIAYTVPEGIADGTYRVLLADADGNQYGANTVKVTSKPMITSGADRFGANTTVTLTGINLDKVASLTIGDQTVSTFAAQTKNELTFTSPNLAVGEYITTGKASDGSSLLFYTSDGDTTVVTTTITAETTLWEGHHYVSWEYEDGNPNKTFNFLGADAFANIKAGTTLKIYYSLEPTASYHQMQLTTGWWTQLPSSAGTYNLTDDPGTIELTLTQADLDLIKEQSGFLCVGHGYYVDRVTTK